MTTSPLSDARRRVAELLKRSEDAVPSQLATRLGVTEVAVRQHLGALQDAGLAKRERRVVDGAVGRGRPAERWRLTEEGHRLFPDTHAELTVGLLDAIRDAHGEAGLDKVIRSRARRQVDSYRGAMPTRGSFERRVMSLAESRSAEGYMAEVRREKKNVYLLVEHHCPICEAATACTGLCKSELDVFQRSLGPGAEVERVQHLLVDGDRCVYRVSKR